MFNFTVYNVNDAPILDYIPDVEACEDTVFYYDIDATDYDLHIPNTPEVLHFYDNTSLFVINENTGEISFTPIYSKVGLYSIRISVSDEEAMDYQDFSLDIIEVNDAPVLQTIGAQTVYVNDSFDYSAYGSDEEDGDSPGTLRFNSTFLVGTELFVINASTGRMNFTANDSMIGNYSIKVCVNDTGLSSPHANASLYCGAEGGGPSRNDCETFSLSITRENRAPNITSYFPLENQTIYETESLTFNVSAIDPEGTITTIYWYVNRTLMQTANSLNDTYIFTTDYTSAGNYTIFVNVSDGMLADFMVWNVTVLNKAPPSPPIPEYISSGGGGAGVCKEVWVCSDWSICQNSSASKFQLGEKYSEIIKECSAIGIPGGACGFQIRTCRQTSRCITELKKPIEMQICHFAISPNCYDGIRNCHGPNNLCEILVDCGGPCSPCPTCSDGIQNQGEEWIDCGGPCQPCPVEYPKPPKCGDKKCEMGEILTCRQDCGLFWITAIILAFLLVIIALMTRREIVKKVSMEKEKEIKKGRSHINNVVRLTKKAIADKDVTLARHYYNETKKAYELLPVKEKKKVYGKIVSLFSDIRKL